MNNALISKGDVYWVNMSNVFSAKDIHAQKGRRPCVIVSNNKNNDSNSRVIIVPLTTQADNLPQHICVYFNGIKNYVVPESITSVPKSFLDRKAGYLSQKAFNGYVIKAIKIQLGIWKGDKNERY